METEKLKAVVISYDPDEFLLTSQYCTGPDRNNTHIGMLSITATDSVSLSLLVIEVVENSGLKENIVGINSDGGGNLWVFREALESKYTIDSVFHQTSIY